MKSDERLSDGNNEGFPLYFGEGAWSSYLKEVDAERVEFLKMFIQMRHISNHLDVIFSKIRWNRVVFKSETGEGIEVATFHKSPCFIATQAILSFIETVVMVALQQQKLVTPQWVFQFMSCLNAIQKNFTCGIACVDAEDFSLGICHLKKGMQSVQKAIALLKEFPTKQIDGESTHFTALCIVKDLQLSLFDIRELLWSGILACTLNVSNQEDG